MILKKIIIIGGSGSIGSSIAKELIEDGFQPHLIGRNEESLKTVSKDLNCEYSVADVNNSEQLKNSIQDCGENIYGLAYSQYHSMICLIHSVAFKGFSFFLNAASRPVTRCFCSSLSVSEMGTITAKLGFRKGEEDGMLDDKRRKSDIIKNPRHHKNDYAGHMVCRSTLCGPQAGGKNAIYAVCDWQHWY